MEQSGSKPGEASLRTLSETTDNADEQSLTLPRLLDWYVERDSVLDNIEFNLRTGIFALYLESDPGFGKTVALAQLARRHRTDALVLFARKDDLVLGQPDILRRDLYQQCQKLLQEAPIADTEQVDAGMLRTAYMRLKRRARLRRESQLVIVDGLDHYSAADAEQLNALHELMPVSPDDFQFVVASRWHQRVLPNVASDRTRAMPVAMLQPEEVRQILSPFGLPDAQLRLYQQLCNGSPNKVASLRRRLAAGVQPGTDSKGAVISDEELFEEEFRVADNAPAPERQLFAVLAADKRSRRVDELAHLTKLSDSVIRSLPRTYTFLIYDTADQSIDYAVEGLRAFAAKRLYAEMPAAYDLLIGEANAAPNESRSLAALPFYYAERHQSEALLAYLSPEYFGAALRQVSARGLVRRGISYGIDAARELDRDSELLRFALYGAGLAALDSAAAWRSEVRAYLALDNYEGALQLAQQTATQEERLRLLAALSRARQDHGLAPDPGLNADVRGLAESIDPDALGSGVYEIASDLFPSQPGIAIELVERTGAKLGRRRARDWGLARLAIEAAHIEEGRERESEQVYDRIRDPEARRFAYEVAAMLAERSGSQVRALSERLEDPQEQAAVLAAWLRNNGARDDAVEVAEAALNLAIAKKVSTISSAFLLDMVQALRAKPLTDRHSKLASLIEGQAESIRGKGATIDYVALRIALASYSFAIDETLGGDRFLDIILFIDALADPLTRASAYARLLAALRVLPPNAAIEQDLQLSWRAVQSLRRDVAAILDGSADHYAVVAPILEQLWSHDPLLAEEVAQQLNTQDRRDLALRDLATSVVVEAPAVDMITVRRLYTAIRTRELKDEVLDSAAERLRKDRVEAKASAIDLPWLLEEASSALAAIQRCRIATELLRSSHNEDTERKTTKLLREAWQSINTVAGRAEVGYRIASELAEQRPGLAREFFDLAEEERRSSPLASPEVADTYHLAVRLVIRAFGALMSQKLAAEIAPAEQALRALIDRIPNDGMKARLWSQIALAYFRSGDESNAQRIVSDVLRPHLEAVRKEDGQYSITVQTEAGPALFLAQQASAIARLAALPHPSDDNALNGVVTFLFRKVPTTDPCDYNSSKGLEIDWKAAVSACDVLERTDEDAVLWSRLGEIADALRTRARRDQFSTEERKDIVRRMEGLVKRFPIAGGIQHEGPRILAQGYTYDAGMKAGAAWRELAAETSRIPNAADRALVRYSLAERMPTAENTTRETLLAEARADIALIPSAEDRVTRLLGLVDVIRAKEKQCAALREAMGLAGTIANEKAVIDKQKEVIDSAHRIDEDFAEELVQSMDSDPAKIGPRRAAKQRLRVLNLNRRLGKPSRTERATKRMSAREYAEAARMALAALNGKRRLAVKLGDDAREALTGVADAPLREGYWVFAWLIENQGKASDASPSFRNALRATFYASVRGADLVFALAGRPKVRGVQSAGETVARTSIVVGARERDKAYKFVGEWLRRQNTKNVIFYDPYFGPDDLDFVQLVQSAQPDAAVVVATSLRGQKSAHVATPYADTYARAWRELSDVEPPDCEIKVIGFEDGGDAPFHDRCILVDGAGCDLGPSWNGVGIARIGRLGEMSADGARETAERLLPFVNRTARSYDGRRLLLRSFTLAQ